MALTSYAALVCAVDGALGAVAARLVRLVALLERPGVVRYLHLERECGKSVLPENGPLIDFVLRLVQIKSFQQ